MSTEEKFLECDKCGCCCHIECTNIPVALFDLLLANSADDGIKWFCHTCRDTIADVVPDSGDNYPAAVIPVDEPADVYPVNTGGSHDTVNNDQIKVCDKLKVGTCPHGVTGKTKVDDKTCEFHHPKLCKRYIRNGPHGQYGCNGQDCTLFHPMLCAESVKDRKCSKSDCKLYHLRRTEHVGKKNKKAAAQKHSRNRGGSRPNKKNAERKSAAKNDQSGTSNVNKDKNVPSGNFLDPFTTLRSEMDARFCHLQSLIMSLRTQPQQSQPHLSRAEFPLLNQNLPPASAHPRW